jgi:predicted dehydrogenase
MIKACVIGLGQRGYFLVESVLLKNSDIDIVSVCDLYEDRVDTTLKKIRERGGDARGFSDWREALNVSGLDAVFVFSDWATHTEISIYAMEKGIAVASEVGCEYSLDNCHTLVRTQEKTGTPYMFMENCCYNRDELLATSMARRGLFGTLIHCSGTYSHDLRKEIAYGHVNRHYRFDNYLNRNCENYPTHELGPIAKLLDINRGNRILTVSSFASKAAGLEEYIATRSDATDEMRAAKFKQGDIVTTILTCAHGETIQIRLDTTLPRSYDREFTVRGTKGMYTQTLHAVFFDGEKEYWEPSDFARQYLCNAKNYEDEYLPSIWKNITPEQQKAGHGGMDWFTYKAFTDAIKNGTPMPIDVYDSAVWQAVSVLSEASIVAGGAPQTMPDFTGGKWIKRPRLDVVEM